jgi:hypothetical protein
MRAWARVFSDWSFARLRISSASVLACATVSWALAVAAEIASLAWRCASVVMFRASALARAVVSSASSRALS